LNPVAVILDLMKPLRPPWRFGLQRGQLGV
jgi:hypothetical protein